MTEHTDVSTGIAGVLKQNSEMKIVIVGLGLIGGSIAKALTANTTHRILASDLDQSVLNDAKSLGAIHGIATDGDICSADIIYLCVYPEAAISFIKQHATDLKKDCIVTDACGVKRKICDEVRNIQKGNHFHFVGGHPMAGKEVTGFAFSDATLFVGASYLLTPATAPEWATECVTKLAYQMGVKQVLKITPKKHDEMISYTSQIPHILACAYVLSPRCKEQAGFSAGSYRDVSRVANINYSLWSKLFLDNSDHLVHEIDTLIYNLEKIKEKISDNREDELNQILKTAADIKRSETFEN